MSAAIFVGCALVLIGAVVSGYTLFLSGAIGLELFSHGTPAGWSGWPDVLFFALVLMAFGALGAVCARTGVRMLRSGAEQDALNLIGFVCLFAAVIGTVYAMRSSLDRLRWALAGALGMLWLSAAAINARIAWREFVRRRKTGPSMIFLVGGMMGIAAVNIMPHQWDAIKWPLRLAVVVLDFGSAPFLLIGVGMLVLGLKRRSN